MCFSSIVIGICTTDNLPAAALRTTEGFECEEPPADDTAGIFITAAGRFRFLHHLSVMTRGNKFHIIHLMYCLTLASSSVIAESYHILHNELTDLIAFPSRSVSIYIKDAHLHLLNESCRNFRSLKLHT